MQGIPGPGVGPGGAKAPACDSDPAPGGASPRQNFFGPAPGGAFAPAENLDPAPGGAFAPAEAADPAPGGAKAPAAPDIYISDVFLLGAAISLKMQQKESWFSFFCLNDAKT